jgi:hypothetical protein
VIIYNFSGKAISSSRDIYSQNLSVRMRKNQKRNNIVGSMKYLTLLSLLIITLCVNTLAQNDSLAAPGEKHFKNIKQLTFGGENAEAYFSFDGKQLIFQSKRDGRGCDQIYSGWCLTARAARPAPIFSRAENAFCIHRHLAGKRNARRILTFRKATSGPSIPITRSTRPRRTVRI